MEHELEVMVTDTSSLAHALVGDDGRLKEHVDLCHGVSLSPLFTSIRKAGAVGIVDVLAFMINIPVGIASQIVAAALYDWMKERGIRRMRVNGLEVVMTEHPTAIVSNVTKALDQPAKPS